MPRKFLYILTILLAALSLTITACETDDDEDATDGTTAAGGTATGGAATGGGATGGAATGGGATGGGTQYQFVRVTDTSGDSGTEDAGADIDAVGVRLAATGETIWASTVEGTSGNVLGDTSAATGAPTAFPDWMTGDTTNCGVNATDDGFTSLGGDGAISLGFAQTFTTGDTVLVYEVGNCAFDGGMARTEAINVDVAVSSDISTAMWVNIFGGEGSPLIEATIP